MRKVLLVLVLASLTSVALGKAADPVPALIEHQTNVTSEAGQRGDQATVERLTDDEIMFSAGDGVLQREQKFDQTGSLSHKLEGETIARLARDPRQAAEIHSGASLFVDETGALNGSVDFTAVPATLSDWVLHQRDDVAVSSFTMNATAGRYLAVEIWLHQRGTWQLVGGQTIPLYADPAPAHLSDQQLHEFAGTYSAGPGSRVEIEAGADGDIISTQMGSPSRHLIAEGDNVFFSTGLPSGYQRAPTMFTRDQDGRVSQFERSGIVFRKVDPSESAVGEAPTPGPLKIRDFRAVHLGNLAIATFFHDRETAYYGQTLHQTFRSMESWIKTNGTWKMISSQGRQV